MSTTTKTAAAVTFSVAAYALACSALVNPASAVTRAMHKAVVTKDGWARIAAVGILADDTAFTIDDAREGLIAAYRATLKTAKARDACTSLNHCDPTLKSWFYDLSRAYKNGLLPLLLEGQSLTGLRRATEAVQPQKPGKRAGKGKAANDTTPAAPIAAQPVALDNLPDLAAALERTLNRMSVKALRNQQKELSRIIQAAAKATRKVEAAIAAAAKAKAPAPARKAA